MNKAAINICVLLLAHSGEISSEQLNLTNPACDPGWMDAHSANLGCLQFGSEAVSYQEAHKICHEARAYLVEIFSAGQMDFMVMELALLQTLTGPRFYWGGGTDMNREGQWYWSHSLRPINDQVWHPSQPNEGILANYFGFLFLFEYYGADVVSDYDGAFPICQKMNTF